MNTPRTDAAAKAAMDDTGRICRMELIWETMMQLETELANAIHECVERGAERDEAIAKVVELRTEMTQRKEAHRNELATMPDKEPRSDPAKRSPLTTSGVVGFAGLLTTVLFITLKLCNVIAWSWWWVLSPIWITAGLVLIVEGLAMVSNRIDRL